ncbi:MAG: protein-L-isoaspartate(D-aspartate) O-methyltransferase [Bacteroidales bacterium]|nr:protein-L-isoaspartate(D-aspartate) O-methyltransferase [Bacteroidales bacterium]
MEDTFQYQGQRRQMVEKLREKKIADENVLRAIGAVPRQFFFEPMFVNYAYEDEPFSIGCGQTISQPSTVAIQSQLLDVKPNAKVLEIGTGSGYQAAVLDKMGAKVFTIERYRELYLKAKKLLAEIAPKVRCKFGDGYKGLPSFGPFDRIIITAAAPEIPDALFQQLKIGGKMVVPVNCSDGTQEMTVVEKLSETDSIKTIEGKFNFVPMLQDKVRT